MTNLHELTIKSFHEGLMNKKFSALEIVQAFFGNIKETDGFGGLTTGGSITLTTGKKIMAYLSLAEESALKDAEQVDLAVAKDEPVGALAGVPLAIKDNILIKDLLATAASKILQNYVASYDATVIKKLKTERAVFLGKTNLDEFAMGASTENSGFQITKNPHDTGRVPGGSSGGSAAAVAAHMAMAALGSDTGGSVRQPSSFCGVVGLKPTYGAVSRSGLIAMASSLDQIGPITKTVEDAAILFKTISGWDELDATAAPVEYGDELLNPDYKNIKGLVVGLPEEYFMKGISPEVSAAVEDAIEKIKSLGLKFKKISLPHTKYGLSCYYIIVPAEVSANLARFDGVRYARIPQTHVRLADSPRFAGEAGAPAKRADGVRTDAERSPHSSASGPRRSALTHIYMRQRGSGFGPEAKRRIILGTFVLSSGYYDAYYEKAQRVRTLIKKDFDEAFKKVDVVLTPVAPTTAFKIGEKTNDPLSMYLSDIFTIPASLAGVPAISIPVKRNLKTGELPVGFQLIGKKWREADILGLGQYYEKISA